MSQDPGSFNPFVTHIDVSTHSNADAQRGQAMFNAPVLVLLQQLVAGQKRQNDLLEDLVQQTSAAQRQRANELGQWKQANPRLADRCRQAAEALSGVQTDFLRNLTDEVNQNAEDYLEGEFLLNEFVDRYGPRLAHLNGVLQILSQLSSVPAASNATN